VQRRLLLLLALLALVAVPCFAGLPAPAEPSLRTRTLEALTAEADLVAVATTNSHPVGSGDEVDTLRLQEVLKAPSGFKGPVVYVRPAYSTRLKRFAASGPGTRLVFVKVRSWDGTTPQEWVLLDLVNLSSVSSTAPVAPLTPDPADSLYAPQIFDGSLTPITSRQKLLDLTRAEVAHPHSAEQVKGYLVWSPLFCVLDDERLPATARKWASSPNPNARMLAARYFADTSDPAEVPLLRALLTDDYTEVSTFRLSPWTPHEYIIREAAAEALAKRHETFVAPDYTDAKTPIYQTFPYIGATVLAGCVIAVYLTARRVKTLLLRGRPEGFLPRLLPGLSLTLTASVLVTMAWHRSMTTADDLVVAQFGALIEATTVKDFVLVKLATQWPLTTPPVHLAVTPDLADEWNPSSQTTFSSTSPFFGGISVDPTLLEVFVGAGHSGWISDFFHFAGGTQDSCVFSYPYPYRSMSHPGLIFIVAHRWLYLPASLPLLLAIAIHAPSHLRRQRRARRGQCLHCGYSLFGLPPGSVCPECGTAPYAKIRSLTAPPPPQM
jgi:hypothetical protein